MAMDGVSADGTPDAPLGLKDALPALALLLPPSTASPLALALRAVRDVIAEAEATRGHAMGTAEAHGISRDRMRSSTVTLARGEASVALIDVRALHRELCADAQTSAAAPAAATAAAAAAAAATAGFNAPGGGDAAALGGGSAGLSGAAAAALHAAVATNGAQERLHAALHVLSACRKLLLQLPLSAQLDGRLAPRLSLLQALLSLLSPPPPPAPPSTSADLAPTLATAALAQLRSLGRYWSMQSATQLELISSALSALLPPAELPAPARTPLYLLLLSLLMPFQAVRSTPGLGPSYAELASMLTSMLTRSGSALLSIASLDALEGTLGTQCAALSLLSTLLSFQPSGSWTVQLCHSGLLSRLTAPLGTTAHSPTQTARPPAFASCPPPAPPPRRPARGPALVPPTTRPLLAPRVARRSQARRRL